MFKALKKEVDNFPMVGAFVLANNTDNVNIDGCLYYVVGISSSLKTVYLNMLIKMCFCF